MRYNPLNIKELSILKGGHNSKHNLGKAFANTMKDKIIVIDENGYEHLIVLFNYLKGTRLNIENAVDKNSYIKHEFYLSHKDTYNYNFVSYNGKDKKVKIICTEHGDFEQTPNNHKRGQGCPHCFDKVKGKMNRKIPIHLESMVNKIRNSITTSFWKKRFTKNSKTAQILGCTWQEFKQHLENNSYGFTIDQKGLDLDHIVPISKARTEQELIKLNHYTNFQLLPKEYNRWIKSYNLFDKEHFNEWLTENQKAKTTP